MALFLNVLWNGRSQKGIRMIATETKVKRIPIREFRASLKATMALPVIVTADGQDAFAVVQVDVLQDLLDRTEAHQVKCPFCGTVGEPKPLPGQGVQAQCGSCRRPFRWVL